MEFATFREEVEVETKPTKETMEMMEIFGQELD
jgi:hypothetical protein